MTRSSHWDYLYRCAEIASRISSDQRFRLVALARRSDGCLVAARNGSSIQPNPASHAEARVLKKIDETTTIYVARVTKGSGELAMARPCVDCQRKMRRRGVEVCVFSISERAYGVMEL